MFHYSCNSPTGFYRFRNFDAAKRWYEPDLLNSNMSCGSDAPLRMEQLARSKHLTFFQNARSTYGEWRQRATSHK